MALKLKKSSQNGGGTAGGATPQEDGKRSRGRKGRDRTPPGWAPPSVLEAEGAGNGAPASAPPASAPAASAPAASAPAMSAPTVPVSGGTAVLPAPEANFFAWLGERRFPSREAAEQEAARELQAAATESLDLLVASVPGAHSPDEAYSRIEANLGDKIDDPDKVVPRHPLWSDDTVVYYHLRRHFGENATTQSLQRRRTHTWYPIRSFGPLE